MCGIAGFIDYYERANNKEKIISDMIETLKFRGPNTNGTYFDNYANLGHTRLAVVDVEKGLQPMVKFHNGKKFVIVYNGELYNTQDLKDDLILKGYKFDTNCDTEVLLSCYIEYGKKCPEMLNGIFAFAIWDGSKLFIARDRFGVKPLFYCIKDGEFIFASEVKALFKHYNIKPIIDKLGLLEIFALGPARSPSSGIFRSIYELKPGRYAFFDKCGLHIKQYFKLTAKEHTDSYEKSVETVRYLLEDAITRQLVSDVPICTLLSGGVDSSIISAVASKHLKVKGKILDTYSFDFEKNNEFFKASKFQAMQDRPYVDIMVDKIGSNHRYLDISYKDTLNSLFEAVIAKDMPSMTDIDSSLMCFSKLIKKNHTVCLSGECADEVFGGYPWFYDEESYTKDEFPWSRDISLRENIINKKLNLDIKDFISENYFNTVNHVSCIAGESELRIKERSLMMLNIEWFMQTLLDRKDRMTMRASLEVRVPFADHRLIEYLYNLPWEYKTKSGVKGILKDAFKDLIPQEVLYRKKTPYPKTYNPNFKNELKIMLKETLLNPNSVLHDICNVKFINELLESNNETETPWFGQLMKKPQIFAYLLQIDFWFKRYNIELNI